MPTHGLISRHGILKLSHTLDHVGVLARSLEDIALLAEQLVGYDESDPGARSLARIPFCAVPAQEPPLPPVFGTARTPFWDRIDADTQEAFEDLTWRSRTVS
jgi:Asp-tRNA(Asn)/Glu-tRNA(Gln) amidotransferase A subunit family amidase